MKYILVTLALASAALACADHSNYLAPHLQRRDNDGASNATAWAYEASFNWGKLSPDYALCFKGTQQSPIALTLQNGLSQNHRPMISYPDVVTGNFYNWKYGPAFTVQRKSAKDWSGNPTMSFDGQTVYLDGWHIHAPADHTVQGFRSRAELHLVHRDAQGKPAAVLGIRIDPGYAANDFLASLPPIIGFNDTKTQVQTSMNIRQLLNHVDNFEEFWTYQGSLTSPPCSEGIRWYVARQILWAGVDQMQAILGASAFSAREEQPVWQHNINV